MMDVLERILSPYTPVIAQAAITITFLHFLSGLFLLNDIRKKRTSTGVPATPFLGGLILSFVCLKFGTLIRDDATIRINLLGFALNVIYLSIYYYYTPNNKKTSIWAKIGITGLLCVASLIYAELEDPKLVENRFGNLTTIVLLSLVGSPFLSLGEIIRTKSTQSLPLPIMISGTIVSIAWLVYALAIKNSVLLIQNALVVLITMAQFSLFLVYPSKPHAKKVKREKKAQ